ncbi:MAG: LLM class F420-dependent oxidoreductase [Acidimicrobiaceae bacterium]|jgi:F420-dependent oxidoreductase-like protein|nr:LLM class F420-dependent oxidoreductase [Acidimicrobiaceae bacterium]MBT5580424.1 LLM class F420-dependent oxidoreductase [Acidimicrobiaceae bacterium]MBT5849014.1 LLM class F420-dependent oxidoreductase [Acidimicrobiaceae bacterium]
MQLGLTWGYWGRSMPADFVVTTKAAEDAGFDAVFSAESWGSDAFTPLALLAAHTERIKLGTGVVQISARTPTATAMHAVTLDQISNGRLILGLGVSGPQLVEGWYGMPSHKPLARTREYVEILRQVFHREGPLEYDGEHYQLPFTGDGAQGQGKSLKIMTHPLRQIPIWIGAEGPNNVAQTCEIADGWFPLYYSPWRAEVYHDQIKDRPLGFEISVNVAMEVTNDVEAALEKVRANLALYVGGMGTKGQNYHTALMARMGFEDAAHTIQSLFLEGRRDEAVAAVPIEFADELSLVGSVDRIKDRLQAWEESAVTMINVRPRSIPELHQIAELVKG